MASYRREEGKVVLLVVTQEDVRKFYALITEGRSAVPSEWLEEVKARMEKVHGHILEKGLGRGMASG